MCVLLLVPSMVSHNIMYKKLYYEQIIATLPHAKCVLNTEKNNSSLSTSTYCTVQINQVSPTA